MAWLRTREMYGRTRGSDPHCMSAELIVFVAAAFETKRSGSRQELLARLRVGARVGEVTQ